MSKYRNGALEGSPQAQKLVTSGLERHLQAYNKPSYILAVEAMLAPIVAPGLIRRVVVDQHWLEIERSGDDFVDPKSFDLRALAMDQFSLLKSEPSQQLLDLLK